MSSALGNAIDQFESRSDRLYEDIDKLRFPLPFDYPIVSVLLEDETYKVVSRNGDDFWDFTELPEGVINFQGG